MNFASDESQVHITQGDRVGEAVYISWITPSAPGSNVVQYGLQSGNYSNSKNAKVSRYTYYNYTSGFIHHARIDNLKVWDGDHQSICLRIFLDSCRSDDSCR
jgi:hypothetical protein